ncbi:MAG: phosphoglucosamine mutase, partial [Planctomycetes bacterium]|nr:phosphoglucosamine mutase [Planctomycetota bacterium]
MSEAPLMIGVSGLRGITGRSLTPEVASRFAAAFGAWLVQRDAAAEPVVVIGRDGRAGGVEIHEAAIAGLRGAGCHVHDIGVAMTPTIAVTCDARNALGAMIVTASHNPQEWNGLKCLVRDGSAGADA